MSRRDFDVIVAGGGAAGLMCALRAGQRGRKVLRARARRQGRQEDPDLRRRALQLHQPLSRPEAFLSANPHFCKSALARYTQHDFIALVEKHRIAWHEKTLGQLFCDGSARQIVGHAARRMRRRRASMCGWRTASPASRRRTASRSSTDHGAFAADRLVLATGGLSIPKMGATGFAHDIARRFGLALAETRPGLVPLTLKVPELSGVSLQVVAQLGRASFREAMLFTHRGLSGPAILQISSYWRPGQEIVGRPAAGYRRGGLPQGSQAHAIQGRAADGAGRGPAAAAGAEPGAGGRDGDPPRSRPRDARGAG